jgi:hypothetical protein
MARAPARPPSGECTPPTTGSIGAARELTRHRMGELEPWIDENFVRSIWYNMGETVNVKMIRDKFSG